MPVSFMQWLDMGGYGAFVWPCYGIAFTLLMALTVVSVRSRRKNIQLLHKLDPKQNSES